MSQTIAWQEEELIDDVADWIARHGLVTPVVVLLEVNKPFSFLGGQALWMLQPLLGPAIGYERIAAYARLLEDSTGVERLLECLESRRAVGQESVGVDDSLP